MRRKVFFVDKDVQGALAIRVVSYWVASLWGVFCVLAGFPIAVTWWLDLPNGPSAATLVSQTWSHFWPAMAASFLVLPFLVRDVVRFSHRFVGPFLRVRSALSELSQGKTVAPLRFRKGDFWFEIAEDVNRLSARLASQPLKAADTPSDEPASPGPVNPGPAHQEPQESIGQELPSGTPQPSADTASANAAPLAPAPGATEREELANA